MTNELMTLGTTPALEFSSDEIAIFKQSYAPDLNPAEFKLFIRTCMVRGLQPGRHLIANVYNKRDPQKRKMVWITTIDGALSIAESSGEYDGTTEATLLVETDTKKSESAPPDVVEVPHRLYNPEHHTRIISATVGVRRKTFSEPVFGTAIFKSFAKTGPGSEVWANHPDLMIIKCALMQSLRKAFPDRIGGMYIQEEDKAMGAGAINVEYQQVSPESAEAPPPVEEPADPNIIEQDFIKALEFFEALGKEGDHEKISNLLMEKLLGAFQVETMEEINPEHRADVQEWLRTLGREHLKEAGLIPDARKAK